MKRQVSRRRHGRCAWVGCVTVTEALALAAAGVAAGILSTVVGLASVVSYPALLAIGLPPLAANMTNTVSLLFTGVGAAVGSRPELSGQATRVRRLGTIAALGGGAGAALLLITPSQTFVRLAPVLIGAASLALLAPSRQDRARRRGAGPGRDELSRGAGPVQPPTRKPPASGTTAAQSTCPNTAKATAATVFAIAPSMFFTAFTRASGSATMAMSRASMTMPPAAPKYPM